MYADRWIVRLMIGFGLLFLAGPIVFWVWASARAADAAAWPSVPGEVVAGRVETHVTTERSETGRGSSTTRVSFEPVVTYAYRVGGRDYRGEDLRLIAGYSFNAPEEAEAFLEDYPVGAAVEVHYDPDRPADAALELDRPTPWVFLVWLFALPCLAVAWFLAPHDRRWPRLGGGRRRQAGNA